ncbi:MAG: helix-turn-helix domain-containing protein [Halobacteriales archaeon]|nr:helix-turn-helix domain-containing protein [Halobacteriales archaeon]
MSVDLDDDQYAMLERLADEPATSKELADELDVSLETIHSFVRELRPAGLIRRETKRQGGRTIYILTHEGRDRIE